MSKENEQKARLLDEFLVNKEEFDKLSDRLNQFNIFDVLKISKAEIRHSNAIAWLLDPLETHSFGDVFLRRFLSRVLHNSELTLNTLSPSKIEVMDFKNIDVQREWKNIDVFVRDQQNKWCMIIENKVKSKESAGQLVRYKKIVEEEFPGFEIVPIFLTLNGEDASEDGKDEDYVPFSHSDIFEILEPLVELSKNKLSDSVFIFLSHYLEILRRLTMKDEELSSLCKAIYKKHKEAIDLIVEYGQSSGIKDDILESVNRVIDGDIINAGANNVYVLPKGWAKMLPEEGTRQSERAYGRKSPIVVYFRQGRKNKDHVFLRVEIWSWGDPEARKALLSGLQKEGYKIWDGAFRDEAKYTRIAYERIKLPTNDDGDVEFTPEQLDQLLKKGWDKFQKDLEKVKGQLEKVRWPKVPKKAAS